MGVFTNAFGIGVGQGALLNLLPETKTYISGLTTPLSGGQVNRINNLVKDLTTGLGSTNLLHDFDAIYLIDGENTDISLRNLVKNAHYATAKNTPEFDKYKGVTGNNTNMYIDTNYNISTDAVVASQDNNSIGIYSVVDQQGNAEVDLGAGDTNVAPYFLVQVLNGSGKCAIHLNSTAYASGVSNDNARGFYMASRLDANSYTVYKNGTSLGVENKTSAPFKNAKLFILATSLNATTGQNFSSKQIGVVIRGRGFTSSEVSIINAAIQKYLTACTQTDVIDYYFSDLHICTQRDNKVLAFNDAGTLMLSTDGGVTYPITKVTSPTITIITFAHLFENGNILFADETKCYYSTDNLLTYSQSTTKGISGSNFVPNTVSNFRSSGNDNASINGNEILVWGNYTLDTEVNAWYSIDGGVTVKSCYKPGVTLTPSATVPARHIHAISFNPADNSFWIQTGDSVTESGWIKGLYNWETDTWAWALIRLNYDYNKSVGIGFIGNYAYWGGDNDAYPTRSGIWKVLYSDIANPASYVKVCNSLAPIGAFRVTGNEIVATPIGFKQVITSKDGVKFTKTTIKGGESLSASYGLYFNIQNKNSNGYYLIDVVTTNETLVSYTKGQVMMVKILNP